MARFCCLWCACVSNECLSRFLICVPVCVCMKIRWLCAKAKAKGNGGACDLIAMSKCVVAKKQQQKNETIPKRRTRPAKRRDWGKQSSEPSACVLRECSLRLGGIYVAGVCVSGFFLAQRACMCRFWELGVQKITRLE